jgi:hypothetical protein
MDDNQPATPTKPMNNTEIVTALCEATGLTKQLVIRGRAS